MSDECSCHVCDKCGRQEYCLYHLKCQPSIEKYEKCLTFIQDCADGSCHMHAIKARELLKELKDGD